MVMWMLAHPHVSGLYNFGTGRAQSLQELAEATFHAMGKEPNIRFIDMPEHLKKKYQYYTKDNCKCKLNSCFNQEHLSIA